MDHKISHLHTILGIFTILVTIYFDLFITGREWVEYISFFSLVVGKEVHV